MDTMKLQNDLNFFHLCLCDTEVFFKCSVSICDNLDM